MNKINFNKLLIGTAFILGMGISTSAIAMETPEVSFHPVASWDISPVKNPQNGQTHCLMMNEYNNGFFIQFQGAQGNVDVMSIDFRQEAFTAGQSENVTLQIPGSAEITLPATAFSPDVLSINMAGKHDLFKNLSSASALDVKIADNAFRFYLTGFANAASSYSRCLSGAPMQVAAPVAPEEPKQAILTPAETEPEEIAVEEVLDQPVETPSKISNAEPDRAAPSKMMRDMSEKAQDRYAEELSVILQEPKEKVSVELQKALDRQNQDVLADDALAMRPEPGKRYTETLAKAMGTPTDKTGDIPSPVQEPIPVVTAEKQPEVINQDVEEAFEEQAEVQQSEITKETAEDIIWNAPPSSKKVEVVDTMTPPPADDLTEPLKTKEVDQSLVKELEEFVGVDKANNQADMSKVATMQTAEPAEEIAPVAEPIDEPALEPVEDISEITPPPVVPEEPKVTSYTTPEYKVNREVIKHEADFTDMDLPVREVKKSSLREPMMDMRDNDEELEKLQSKVERLKRENDALNNELEMVLRSGEKERLEISSDNWNLEAATMKYNEAERQIAKLGQQIQKERAQFEYEKKELEMMLFDPAVTEDAQLARLGSLEKKIKKLETEMALQEEQYERQIQMLKSRNSQ